MAIAVSRNFLLTLSAENFLAPAASRADDAADDGEASRDGVADAGAASDDDGAPALAEATAPVRLDDDMGVGVGERIVGGAVAVDVDAGVLPVAVGVADSDTPATDASAELSTEEATGASLVSACLGIDSAAEGAAED